MGFSAYGSFDPLPARGWAASASAHDVTLGMPGGGGGDVADDLADSFLASPAGSLATGLDASYTNQFVDVRPALPYGRGAVDGARDATDARLRG